MSQCAAIGDLHHALTSGAATVSSVYAELGEIVCGKKPGRTSAEEITIFDSTGKGVAGRGQRCFGLREGGDGRQRDKTRLWKPVEWLRAHAWKASERGNLYYRK